MRLVADAYEAHVLVEKRGFLAFVTFAVPVKSKLKGDKLISLGAFVLDHRVFLALSGLLFSSDRSVLLDVAALGWDSLILLDDVGVVLSACVVG